MDFNKVVNAVTKFLLNIAIEAQDKRLEYEKKQDKEFIKRMDSDFRKLSKEMDDTVKKL